MSQSKMLTIRRRKQATKKRMARMTKQAKKLKQQGKTARPAGAQEGHS